MMYSRGGKREEWWRGVCGKVVLRARESKCQQKGKRSWSVTDMIHSAGPQLCFKEMFCRVFPRGQVALTRLLFMATEIGFSTTVKHKICQNKLSDIVDGLVINI